jgi:hypothetical protein
LWRITGDSGERRRFCDGNKGVDRWWTALAPEIVSDVVITTGCEFETLYINAPFRGKTRHAFFGQARVGANDREISFLQTNPPG